MVYNIDWEYIRFRGCRDDPELHLFFVLRPLWCYARRMGAGKLYAYKDGRYFVGFVLNRETILTPKE